MKAAKLAKLFFLLGIVLSTFGVMTFAATQGVSPAKATFAGGCFWCMEPPYDEMKGVLATTSG